MLHLTNGDCAGDLLRRSGLLGDVIVWPDVLYEGPVPAEHGPVWREARARYHGGSDRQAYEQFLREFETTDAALDRLREQDELVLWFEHDLFDQLLLARHLHWLGVQGPVDTRLSLICIDRYPGVEPFHGLGQLTPEQLASLFPQRQRITAAMIRAGSDLWRAFTAPDPRALEVVATRGIPELPFIAGAMMRFLEEFPGTGDGLSRTERTVLRAIARGLHDPSEIFLAVQQEEERVFMGDLSFWTIVRQMARGTVPLVDIRIDRERPLRLPEGDVSMTAAGARVLAGEADAVMLRGIDRWLGGVHVNGTQTSWRWDGVTRALIAASQHS